MPIFPLFDKISRLFIWQGNAFERKLRLVSWVIVCRRKKFGGLRIN